jgi:hypothetical protein
MKNILNYLQFYIKKNLTNKGLWLKLDKSLSFWIFLIIKFADTAR